jgi:superfamily II DNA or RNA helicase
MTTNGNSNMTNVETLPEVDPPPVVDRLQHDIGAEFYEPCLSVTTQYDRGVGYFTTPWFRETAAGMTALVENGGTARWVVSPKLNEDDADALQAGFEARSEPADVMELIEPEIEDLQTELEVDTRNTVGWLIADGIIDIKIALPTDFDDAIYHDKFGILTDGEDNRVSFHGSMNDSQQAYRNIEAFTIDCDWYGQREVATVDEHQRRFERLWSGDFEGIKTVSLPEAAKQGLLDLRETDRPTYLKTASDGGKGKVTTTADAEGNADDGKADLRETITLRDYQQSAIDAWADNSHRGIMQMATGLGKTITAEAAIDRYSASVDQDALVVIAVPESYLGKQWHDELTKWGFDEPVMAYSSENSDWTGELSGLVTDTEVLEEVSPGIAITTHDSFHKDGFLEQIERANLPCMLIVDEVHGAGTTTRQHGLSEQYAARLGLSATPERYMDPVGTEALESYFDDTVFEYGLADGIPEYLSPYEYHPVPVELTEREAEEYIAESQRLATAIESDDASDDDVSRLAQKRAEITKTASQKRRALTGILSDIDQLENMLIFAHHEQVNSVTDTLHDHDIKYHQYTQHESPSERERLIDAFGRVDGGLDALVGIHCLDEGVDVSSAQTAILMASTGNPRQFVQRRGRVLRQHDGKEKAQIYDLIVIPPRSHFDELLDSERSLLLKQLDRHEEFAETANNEAEAKAVVADLKSALEK